MEAQCKLIFDQFEPESKAEPEESRSLEERLNERFNGAGGAESYVDPTAKRRVAHDLPSGSRPPDRSFQCKPQHVQSAMQSVYWRQEAMRKQRAEEEERATQELERQQTLLDSVQSAAPVSKRWASIAPVSNIIALQNAKKKIEELKQVSRSEN